MVYNIEDYLIELNDKSNVDFKLVSENGEVIFDSIKNKSLDDLESVECFLETETADLYIEKQYHVCASLLKYSIENKYKELFSIREQLIVDILNGKSVATDSLYNSLPFLSSKCTMYLIYVDKYKYEVLSMMKECYEKEQAISFIYDEYVILIGHFEDKDEHAKSIQDLIESNMFSSSHISYIDFDGDACDIIKSYKAAKLLMKIGIKYELRETIYNQDSILFEKMVYNVSRDVKEEVFNKFKDKLSKLDLEMINTIEEFFNNDLNVSEAAKKLYIHRNTLIYRLDKIQKDTGYDLRNFKQASVFMIALLVWKEKKSI